MLEIYFSIYQCSEMYLANLVWGGGGYKILQIEHWADNLMSISKIITNWHILPKFCLTCYFGKHFFWGTPPPPRGFK